MQRSSNTHLDAKVTETVTRTCVNHDHQMLYCFLAPASGAAGAAWSPARRGGRPSAPPTRPATRGAPAPAAAAAGGPAVVERAEPVSALLILFFPGRHQAHQRRQQQLQVVLRWSRAVTSQCSSYSFHPWATPGAPAPAAAAAGGPARVKSSNQSVLFLFFSSLGDTRRRHEAHQCRQQLLSSVIQATQECQQRRRHALEEACSILRTSV